MLGNREDAEDAVQDAVIQAYKKFSQLKNPDAFKSWLFTILCNRCKRRLRNIIRKRNFQINSDISMLSVSDKAGGFQSAIEIYNEIEKLSFDEKLIFNLSIHGGYKSQEISKIVNIPEGTVRSKLHRAIHKVKKTLNEVE